MNPGVVGGIIGSVVGVMGGLLGTYCSIRNTRGPREKAFMIKASIVCWVAVLLLLGFVVVLPNPYRWFAWIPYSILLPLGIQYANRKQQMIQREEAGNHCGVGTD